jgi:hypothetical protein
MFKRRKPPGGYSSTPGYLAAGLAISSIAAALRCRAVGRCASQQATLQKYSLTLPELHVDTEQRQYLALSAIGLRHIEQTANPADMPAAYRRAA